MSLDSFYGGKQGASPIVKARFKYIDTKDPAYIAAKNLVANEADLKDDTMELCFQNPEYTQVWYGQLCIIDTTNKRNPNNGKLFRRVLPRAKSVYEEDGGTPNAEYIGRIIGPSEGYPTVRFGSLEQMVQMAQEEYDGDVDIVYPINDNGDIIKEHVDANYIALDREYDEDDSEEQNKRIHVLKATQTEGNLIPGAIEPEKEGDEWYYEKGINYSWVNIRSNIEGIDQDTFVYLGFEIPYTVFDFKMSDIDWYKKATQELLNKKEYLNGEQPFFQHWKISIPRGQPGYYASNLRSTKRDEFRNWDSENTAKPILYDFKDITILNDGKYLIPSYPLYPTAFNGVEIQEGATIVVYTYHFFSRNGEDAQPREETINCYLGQIRDLDEIILDEHGLVTVKYTDKTSAVLNEDYPLKWIESITFHPKGESKEEPDNWGYITVTYNTIDPDNPEDPESGVHSHETTNFYLHLIDKVRTTVPENSDYGIIEIKYKDQEEGEWEPVEDFSYRFVDDFKVEKDSKELKYHTNPNINGFMSFVDPVYLNTIEETYVGLDGNLYVKYSSSKYRVDPNEREYIDGQFIDSLEQNPPLYIYFDEKDREWRKGGFLPDANDEEPVWWLNLGNIVKYDAHVNIVQELQWDRFAKIHGYTSAEEMDPEQFSREDILRILNSSEIDITLSDKYKWVYNGIDYNPYVNGHILAFPPPTGDEDEDLIPNERYSEDFKGQLVFANHMAFYYDYNIGRWKYAGPWGGDPDKAPAKVIAEDKEKSFVPGVDEEAKIDLNYYGFYFGALGDKEQDSKLEDLGFIYEPDESDDNDEGDISLKGTAYAVLDDAGTLTFFRSENEYTAGTGKTVTDVAGNSYTGQVYTDVENTGTNYNSAPWYKQRKSVTLARIADRQVIMPKSCVAWFSGCSNMTAFEGAEWLDTSAVTSMSDMFYGCSKMTLPPEVGGWDTSAVTNMNHMFAFAAMTVPPAVGSWNTGAVTNMSNMFLNCSAMIAPPAVGNWDTSAVTHMSHMFEGCSAMTEPPDMSSWNTGKVTDISRMFDKCSSMMDPPAVGSWDTSNVISMALMFEDCSSMTKPPAVGSWDTSAVTDMFGMFYGCSDAGFTSIDVSGWNISEVTTMDFMFNNCSNLTTIYTASDANWGASTKLTNSGGMFSGCTKLKGGNDTVFNSSYQDKTYARVDKDGQPGYFTAKPNA